MNFGMRCAHSWNILGRRHHASCFRHCYTINHIRRGFRYLAGWISGLRISDRASCCQFYIWRSVRSVCVRVPPIFFQATDNFCVIFFLLLVCCYDNSPEKKKKTRKRSSPNICVSFVSIFLCCERATWTFNWPLNHLVRQNINCIIGIWVSVYELACHLYHTSSP